MNTTPLRNLIDTFAMRSWGDYEGIKELSLEDVIKIKAMAEFALTTCKEDLQ